MTLKLEEVLWGGHEAMTLISLYWYLPGRIELRQ